MSTYPNLPAKVAEFHGQANQIPLQRSQHCVAAMGFGGYAFQSPQVGFVHVGLQFFWIYFGPSHQPDCMVKVMMFGANMVE